MSNPIVSVVMSVYIPESSDCYDDNIRYLYQAVESILHQTFTDFEYIIVNDGSSHHVANILNDYALRDKRIRVVHQKNCGLIASLNKAINQAHGIYIARMDADDISLPQRFFEQISYIEKHPNLVLIGSSMSCIDRNGKVFLEYNYPTGNEELQKLLIQSNYFVHSSVLFRRDAFLSVGMYREDYIHGEDYDLWLRLSEYGDIANNPMPLLQYRVHNNISWQKCPQQVKAVFAAKRSAYERRNISCEHEVENNSSGDQEIFSTKIEIAIAEHYNFWAILSMKSGQYEIAQQILNIAMERCRISSVVPRNIRAKLVRTFVLLSWRRKKIFLVFYYLFLMIRVRYSL